MVYSNASLGALPYTYTLYAVDWFAVPVGCSLSECQQIERYGKPLRRGDGKKLVKFANDNPNFRFVCEPGTLVGGYWADTRDDGATCYHIL
jgi:hypothetical protein